MELTQLPVSLIRFKTYADGRVWNLRGDVGDTHDIQESARDIGIQKPLEVTQPDAQGFYYLIDGHRRFTANRALLQVARTEWENAKRRNASNRPALEARVALFSSLPVLILDIPPDDTEAIFDGMLLSMVHKNPDPIAVAHAIQRLREQHGYSVSRVAKKLGIDIAKVEQFLGTLNASPSVQSALKSGKIALTTYDRYLKGSSQERQERLLKTIAKAEKAPTGQNVLDAIRDEQKHSREHQYVLPQFADLDVMPALNSALERLRYATGKYSAWSESTRIAARDILVEMDDMIELYAEKDMIDG